MRRREFIPFLVGTTVAWPFAAQTQPSTKVRRIGVLLGYNEDEREIQGWLGAFRESMEKLGWTEGQSGGLDPASDGLGRADHP